MKKGDNLAEQNKKKSILPFHNAASKQSEKPRKLSVCFPNCTPALCKEAIFGQLHH